MSKKWINNNKSVKNRRKREKCVTIVFKIFIAFFFAHFLYSSSNSVIVPFHTQIWIMKKLLFKMSWKWKRMGKNWRMSLKVWISNFMLLLTNYCRERWKWLNIFLAFMIAWNISLYHNYQAIILFKFIYFPEQF